MTTTPTTALQLAWSDDWDAPPAPPTHRIRVWDNVTALHTSTELGGGRVEVAVQTIPASATQLVPVVAVQLHVPSPAPVWDTTTEPGRAAVSDLIASLQATLEAGRGCEDCGAPPAAECYAACLSYVQEG